MTMIRRLRARKAVAALVLAARLAWHPVPRPRAFPRTEGDR